MKNVYICSPLAGDIAGNMEKARKYCAFAVREGVMPWAPHIYFPQFLDDDNPADRKIGLEEGMKWLSRCDAIWVFGNVVSRGMRAELDWARKHGLDIRYFSETCVENSDERRVSAV